MDDHRPCYIYSQNLMFDQYESNCMLLELNKKKIYVHVCLSCVREDSPTSFFYGRATKEKRVYIFFYHSSMGTNNLCLVANPPTPLEKSS